MNHSPDRWGERGGGIFFGTAVFFFFFWDLVIFKAKWGDVSIIICFLFCFFGGGAGGDGDDVGVDDARLRYGWHYGWEVLITYAQ